MKIVFLDVKTIGEDIDLSGFDRFGEVVKYDFSTSEEVPERVNRSTRKKTLRSSVWDICLSRQSRYGNA